MDSRLVGGHRVRSGGGDVTRDDVNQTGGILDRDLDASTFPVSDVQPRAVSADVTMQPDLEDKCSTFPYERIVVSHDDALDRRRFRAVTDVSTIIHRIVLAVLASAPGRARFEHPYRAIVFSHAQCLSLSPKRGHPLYS